MSQELKPCPFCDHKATMSDADVGWAAVCSNEICEAMTGRWSTQEQATAAWNTRANPQAHKEQ